MIENTFKKYFFEYHAQKFPNSMPPMWSQSESDKCELYPYSKIVQAVLESEREMSPVLSNAPLEKLPDRFESELNIVYEYLLGKYQANNPIENPIYPCTI